jgi:hypothetical protein
VTSTSTAPVVGSILLGSTNAQALREWYQRAIAPDYTGEGPISVGPILLVIDQRSDVDATNSQPGRFILNFHVDDIDAIESRLRDVNVKWIAPIEERPAGRFGTFADPDGNYLQVIKFTGKP